MKNSLLALLLLAAAGLAACCGGRERTLVVLSTNDMHGKIQRMPQLATAVRQCRDTTANVLLVDAGDRWTGNAYVDRVPEPGRPIIELMNRLGYDAATLGNHEFDHGQAYLGGVLDSVVGFPVLCANVVSDTCTFPQPEPWRIVERAGLKIGIVGVVTNYEGPGHPAGNAESFAGLRFPDPQQAAVEAADALRGKVDLLLLVSHMGDDRDMELLAREGRYDLLIGGHTHKLRDTVICGTQLTQTAKDLQYLGVTKIRLKGREVLGVDYENVPIGRFAPDSAMQAAVDHYYADPELNRPVGRFAAGASRIGLANWFAELSRKATGSEVGFYHYGGVRLDTLAAGDVGKAPIYDLEPFGSHVATMTMTPEQMERMILTKYNEPTREGGRIDLFSTTPYIITVDDATNRATAVRFPTLQAGRPYRVAIGDYAFRNYKELSYDEGAVGPLLYTDLMFEALRQAPVVPDNTLYNEVWRAVSCR